MTDERERNRAAMPNCVAAVDKLRAMYGAENVKVWELTEGGKTIGKQPTPDAGTWECSADTWLAMQGPEPVAKGWKR